MPLFNCVNSYIPKYVKPDLKWYERDGIMTWYSELKYIEFKSDPQKWFNNVNVKNFDITHIECRKDPLKRVSRRCKTVSTNYLKNYPFYRKKQ